MSTDLAGPWDIVRLSAHHDRSGFECGKTTLDDWLKRRAGQFEKRDLARTYVAVAVGRAAVVGYYAISNHRVAFDALPPEQAKGLPRLDIPVVLLGRLAVDRSAHGRGLGSLLLLDALRRAQALAEHVGVRAVEVEAIDDDARRFYQKFGFMSLLDDSNHLLLPMNVVRRLDLPPPSGESQKIRS